MAYSFELHNNVQKPNGFLARARKVRISCSILPTAAIDREKEGQKRIRTTALRSELLSVLSEMATHRFFYLMDGQTFFEPKRNYVMEIAPYKKEINKIKRKERQSVDSLRTERFFEEGEHRTDPQTKKPRSKIVQSSDNC